MTEKKTKTKKDLKMKVEPKLKAKLSKTLKPKAKEVKAKTTKVKIVKAKVTKPKVVVNPTQDFAKEIAQVAYDTKAHDILVLEVRELSSIADYFVIASGKSDRQVQAIADRIQSHFKTKQRLPLSSEGHQQGHWILVDFGSVIVHIFHEEKREFYGLEKFWGDAPQIKFKLK